MTQQLEHPLKGIYTMRNAFCWLFALVVGAFLIYEGVNSRVMAHSTRTQSDISLPRLEYLKAVNNVGPPKVPQLLFLLMAEYANANRQAEGMEFLSARLSEFSPRLTEPAGEGILLCEDMVTPPVFSTDPWLSWIVV